MSNITVKQTHSLGVEEAKKALAAFEGDIAKFGMKLVWSGSRAELKGTGASGDVLVTAEQVTVNVKLGMVAKMAGVDAKRVEGSLTKRLAAALNPGTEIA